MYSGTSPNLSSATARGRHVDIVSGSFGAPGSWRSTVEATGLLLDRWSGADVLVGPLREHW